MQPNHDAIKQHLSFLFDGMDDYQDGRMEISLLDSSENLLFGSIDQAVDLAIKWNNQGKNVYTVGSLMSPHVMPFGRNADKDFYATNVLWCDIDEPTDIPALREKYAHCPPSMVVITGRTPHVRMHLWWKLDEAITDAAILRKTLQGIQLCLGGDPAAKNPTRLMRIGGSIAWPTKNGRIKELTEVAVPQNGKITTLEMVQTAYPLPEQKDKISLNLETNRKTLNLSSEWSQDDIVNMLRYVDADKHYLDWLQIGMALKDGGYAFHVWDQWSSRGSNYNQAIMDKKWSSFKGAGTTIGTLVHFAKEGGWTPAEKAITQEIKTVKTLVTVNSVTGEVTEEPIIEPEKPVIKATSIKDIDLDHIPPREFLFGTLAVRKYVSMVVAPPGVGKSIFTMQMGMYAAMGQSWGSMQAKKPLNVWIYNNEEGADEINRRLKAILMDSDMAVSDIPGEIYIDSGENRSINMAKLDNGSVVIDPDFEALKDEVIARNIDILIVDPFAETHTIQESNNDQIKIVAALFRQISQQANCAVILVHHARKGAEGANNQQHGNADTARGGGASIGVVRRAVTLAHMTEKDAEKLNIDPNERRKYVRLDDAKSNITPAADKVEWFKFKSVDIMNGAGLYPEGDSIGVLEALDMEQISNQNYSDMKNNSSAIYHHVVEIMDNMGWSETSISILSGQLIHDNRTELKDRQLRATLAKMIQEMPETFFVTYNGKHHFLTISNKRGERNSVLVCKKTRPVMED